MHCSLLYPFIPGIKHALNFMVSQLLIQNSFNDLKKRFSTSNHARLLVTDSLLEKYFQSLIVYWLVADIYFVL